MAVKLPSNLNYVLILARIYFSQFFKLEYNFSYWNCNRKIFFKLSNHKIKRTSIAEKIKKGLKAKGSGSNQKL